MIARMVISFPSTRHGELVLNRISMDYSGCSSVKEIEEHNELWSYRLYMMHYREIVAMNSEPLIYVELESDYDWDKEYPEELEKPIDNETELQDFI